VTDTFTPMTAEEIATEIAKAPLPLHEKLSWHLNNFDRPIGDTFVPVCVRAVEIANAGGNLLERLTLPDGVLCDGEPTATVQDIIDDHYLHFYLETPNE
jgi:hypothetical protein